jgi:hypothetical protein
MFIFVTLKIYLPMKKSLLFVSLALLFIGTANAQLQVPNDGFETWKPDGISGALNPNSGSGSSSWWDFNMFNSPFLGSSPVSVFRESTTVYSGTYSAKIVSVALTHNSDSLVNTYNYGILDTMGIMVTATVTESFSGAAVTLGIPFTNPITEFDFYYQYAPNGTDTASCSVQLWRHVGSKRKIIGAGLFVTHSTVSSWTLGQAHITYDTVCAPDSILILFNATSNYIKPKAGSILYVDSANAINAGINEINAPSANVDIYPNPASSQVNFRISAAGSEQGHTIQVYDITGKMVNSYPVANNHATINTSTYNSGLYFYQLYDKDGQQLSVGKFSVVK